MEAPNQTEVSVSASTSMHLPYLRAAEDEQSRGSYYSPLPPNENEPCAFIRDDTLSCMIVVLTFWFFVSVTLILGVYGAANLRLGPNCSLLIKPNPLFVDYIKVEQLHDTVVTGQMLYGFYEAPPLDVVTNWYFSYSASLQANSNKDWIYFLNEGSQINISYSVNSSSSSSLVLVIAQGNDGFAKFLQDPSYPNTTLSWNIIHGNGMIHQDIRKSSTYYIAVGNLNSEAMEVHLNLKIKDFLYNTTGAYFTCTLTQGGCSLKTFFPKGNVAVLTTPGPEEGTSDDGWYVRLSYGPRWSTYLVGIGGMTILLLVVFHLFTKFGCNHEDRTRAESRETGPERAPLLSHKDDDDVSSWGSSCDSGEDCEDGLVTGSDGKQLIDDEYNNNKRRLCAICFDALRDCFFLPCGHCVACFACGTRIAEAAGTCPICRRRMKKVRKIYTV